VWVILTQGRGGTLRRNGWRHYLDPSGSSIGMPAYLDAYRARLAPAAERLIGVSLECRPGLEVIGAYGRTPDTLLYVDPPYLGSTRTSTNYAHDMPRPSDHRERAAAAAVVVSGYPSALYDEDLYADWHRAEIPTTTGQGNQRSLRTEVLWSNRPIGERTLLDELAGATS
jgi:DNA adenine methylase